MIRFLDSCSNRYGFDGWALSIDGRVLDWSTCTTRSECRQLRVDLADLFESRAQIVKVKISVEAV